MDSPVPTSPISASLASHRSTVQLDEEFARLVKALVEHGSVALQRLVDLQNKGWNDESTARHFEKQREDADHPSSAKKKAWFQQMKKIFGEIDKGLKCVPTLKSMKFLDLGCCPGGFASYILETNSTSRGFGISLPVAEGGHEFSLPAHLRRRFKLSYANLTYYQLGPSQLNDHRLRPLPNSILSRSFDMAVLDGHQLRVQTSASPWDGDRLLISQLILSLQAVKPGGTIVLKLPLPHRPVAAKILYMFSVVSSQVQGWKPKTAHKNRGTFYAVAKDIGQGEDGARLPGILGALKELWVELTFGGEEGKGRHIHPEDLDFLISTDDLVKDHLGWLVRFGTPLWQCQGDALDVFYQRKKF
ncbi:hypothetical protein DXG01_003732 [Tephrocybe rancida]|nr:hypothetical protein DXG01_003732 [Tephrocybe rancida]